MFATTHQLNSTQLNSTHSSLNGPLLLPSPNAAVRLLSLFLFLLVFLAGVATVAFGGDPEAGVAVLERCVLGSEVDAFGVVARLLVAALGEGAGAGAELGADGGVGSHPVCEGVFAVLDDTGRWRLRLARGIERDLGGVGVRGETYALEAS